MLHKVLRDDINFPGGRELLRLTLKGKKQELEDKNYTLVYTDATWIDSAYTMKSCWQGPDFHGARPPVNKGQRLIVLHAGTRAGFIPGAKLVYKASKTTGDYHSEMCGDTYKRWLMERLLPNLTGKCAIVMDNASYYSMREEKFPTSATLKESIKTWLQKHNVTFDARMTKKQLLELAKMHKPAPTYTVDTIIRSHGHEVLRLPPYHPDFNAIELIWSQLKDIVRHRNVTYRFDDMLKITNEAFADIGADRWANACDHVENVIADMKRADHFTGEPPAEVVIHINGSDSEDTDTADEGPSSTDTASEGEN